MSNQQHPITPPPEMVEKWVSEIWHEGTPVRVAASDIHIATESARWGADQELESCLEWVIKTPLYDTTFSALRTARRPNPPSDKEMALEALDTYIYGEPDPKVHARTYNIIRRALEALPND